MKTFKEFLNEELLTEAYRVPTAKVIDAIPYGNNREYVAFEFEEVKKMTAEYFNNVKVTQQLSDKFDQDVSRTYHFEFVGAPKSGRYQDEPPFRMYFNIEKPVAASTPNYLMGEGFFYESATIYMSADPKGRKPASWVRIPAKQDTLSYSGGQNKSLQVMNGFMKKYAAGCKKALTTQPKRVYDHVRDDMIKFFK